MTGHCTVGQVVYLRTDWQSVQPGAARPCLSVLPLLQFFAARDDSSATPAPEGRYIIAQCVSTGKGVRERRAPERGGRVGDDCFFRPVPGLAHLLCGPRARALGYSVSPCGLRVHPFRLRLSRFVGRTPSSARDPLVALLPSSPTLTTDGPLP
jgi:hypothetical protein